MTHMQIIWKQGLEQLRFKYASRNKKKEFTQIIGQLTDLDNFQADRDRFLMRYISKCKIAHALVFFQWRYMTIADPVVK